jgi:hypothetical protein
MSYLLGHERNQTSIRKNTLCAQLHTCFLSDPLPKRKDGKDIILDLSTSESYVGNEFLCSAPDILCPVQNEGTHDKIIMQAEIGLCPFIFCSVLK